ncbi:hypothetical protein [Alginatibacterium sediminis]|uniref:hypothetical protein n=1 Tax=Alginatibacterium sediminis TaxID=2164068 RepID=UPI0018F30EA3|nr:hypothetical protein [Alginatibacterium sediminis]
MNLYKLSLVVMFVCAPSVAIASGHGATHNHSHNHYNPALEALGNDIIGLTVCYKNGYLSNEDQEPAFSNLVNYAGVAGEELGMFYMDKLGPKAELIMADESARVLWHEDFCNELTQTYLDDEQLESGHHHFDGHGHDHGHGVLSAEIVAQDVERGRLLRVQ